LSTKTVRRLVLGLMFLCLAFLGVLGVAQTPASSDLLVVRTISTACAIPESVFLVTLHVEVGEDLQGVGIEETLPYGWKIHPLENDGAAFKRSQSQWTFSGKIKAGSKIDICYEVTIPAAEKLYADTLPECFSITGIFQSKVPAFETTVTGDSDVEVVSSLPVMSAIAHLVPASEKHPVDMVDLRLGQKITREQFARAMDLWRTDGVIPATGGETIDLTLMEKIISYYETCTPVDELLPLADNFVLHGVRTITTFLPSDTVLLPNGCLDPGIQARQLVVTVEVTAEHDAYGAGLREWFPAGWHVTPLKNDGFVYRPSHAEWIYPERLAAGEKRTIVYQVETAPTPPEGMDCEVGCCGQDTTIVGTISAALGCGEHDVTGEDTVHIWQCLPVILAISRWDASDDSLDVTLSNNISFPQVQRAVAFWQQSAAVPYTCGYTVGYETLKTIVTHWLTGTPVTEALPGGEPAVTSTRAAPGSYKWFCQMKDEQPSEDQAKVPTSPVAVHAQVDRQLTCLLPVATLTATVSGGLPPYTFVWKDSGGNKIGSDKDITVDKSGTYVVMVSSAGCCAGSDFVTVTQDIVPPTVSAGPDQLLTCAVTSVTLDGSASGGTPPYTYSWVDAAGNIVGKTEDVTIDQPGTYTLTVTGANGCSGSDSVVVDQDIVPPMVDADSDQTITCANTTAKLDATVSSGKPPYTYEWRNANGDVVGCTEDIIVDQPGLYTLTATGLNGCSASDSVTVNEDITPPTVEIVPSATVLTCFVDQITLKAKVGGGCSVHDYSWKDSQGDEVGCTDQITVDAPGTYTLTVTASNGCSASANVSITQDIVPPTVSAGPDQVLICCVTSVTLDGSASGGSPPYIYQWTDAAGNVIGTSEDITVDEPGMYMFTLTGANGCAATDSVSVSQDITVPIVAIADPQTLSCLVTSVTLDGSASSGTPPYTYAWADADANIVGTTEDVDVSEPGTYTLMVTGANCCSASSCVTVNQDIEPPVIDAGPDRELTCLVDAVTLSVCASGGKEPYLFLWRDERGTMLSTEQTLVVNSPGTYRVTVVGANGCCASGEVILSKNTTPPDVDAGLNKVITCANPEVHIDANISSGQEPYDIKWLNDCGDTVATTEDITVTLPGVYTIVVTGANGCTASDSVTVVDGIIPPRVDAGADKVLTCENEEVLLDATVSGGACPYTYRWTNSCGAVVGDTEDLTVSLPSVYTLTVTSADGCVGSDSVEVKKEE